MDALISECGKYRYSLERDTGPLWPEKDPIIFIMLNPSTADHIDNDPTITRCIGFANKWFRSALIVGNLYAFRATNPKELWKASDPVGPENDFHLSEMMKRTKDIVCAWGNNAKSKRVYEFLDIAHNAGARLWCLSITKQGQPQHPLFVKADTGLIEFRYNRAR